MADPRATQDARAQGAQKEIEQEHARLSIYQAAADFWRSYEERLLATEGPMFKYARDMPDATQWRAPQAPAAFADRLDAGHKSIQTWLDGATALREKFSRLVDRLPRALNAVDPVSARDELVALFGEIKTELDMLPKAQNWAGPNAMNAQGPANKPGSGGPGGGPTDPGGSGMKESTQDPGATQPGGEEPGAGQPGGATDQTGTDQFSAPDPGVDTGVDDFGTNPIGSPGFNPSVDDPFVPRPDPSLAGTPSATLTPPALSPLSPGSSLPSPLTASSPSTHPAASPFPLTPMGSLPTQTGSPARRGVSEVDGQPVRPGTGESSSRTSSGFYPGAIPPMYPPMGGGAGSGGVGSGEAPYGRGHNRRASARESRRAGLQPQLLGRAGARAEEEVEPLQPFSGDEVLDEELWQVPGAAPATPPEPEGRRRQW